MLDEDASHQPPATAAWWRLHTPPNEDGNILLMETDATDEKRTPTWCSWEFFDGYDVIIDTGFDRPTKVRLAQGFRTYIDVLSDGPPTPSPLWQRLTRPGDFTHPSDLA